MLGPNVMTVSYYFSYLPTEKRRQKHIKQWEANSMLVFNTHQVYWNVLHWAYLCSLTEKCIAPTHEIECKFLPGYLRELTFLFRSYAHCHRYDQAMVNLLLSNWNKYHEEMYTAGRYNDILDVMRIVTHRYKLVSCEWGIQFLNSIQFKKSVFSYFTKCIHTYISPRRERKRAAEDIRTRI